MKRACLFYIVFFLFTAICHAADTSIVKSPDGNIVFRLFQKERQLCFSISFLGRSVVTTSPILFSIDGIPVSSAIENNKPVRYSRNETYAIAGVHAKATDRCNGAIFRFTPQKDISNAMLEVRVFNDGVAFRQKLSRPSSVPAETTVFNIPSHSSIWYHDLYMHYEGVHVKKLVDSVMEGEWVAPPATFKLPQGGYASITEAGLLDYPGMALQSNGRNGLVLRLANDQPASYPYVLRYSPQDTLRLKQPAVISDSVVTPWRVVMIGKDLNTLVNSDIVSNLNPPPAKNLFPDGIHTQWIHPGRAVWKYLDGGGDGTPEVMKHFTDAAAALGFEHNILEGFWTRWPDVQLKDLVDYSRKKGVGIWLWKHSKSLRNAAARDSFFAKCSAFGITGAKIDFFDHEAKETIDLYRAILSDAAKYHVMVDFHGANKPTGLSRTYPNAMVYEGVKGMESSKLVDRATHETTIPFTRLLAGPAEYTVVHFGSRRRNTTWAHQVASAAILSAPLLTYAANPDTILLNPMAPIIRNIPATWDETIVLPPSEIGELAIYARRKGDTWFLAVMNGVQAKKISIPLKFLQGSYTATVAKDDPANSASVLMETRKYSSADILRLELEPGGGFIAQFIK